jgi:hypothetical protein
MESLNKRIAAVLIKKSDTKKRKAQMDMDKMQMEKKKVDPKIKLLDHMYEALADEDVSSALDCLYKLTSQLHLEDEVSFDIPEEHREESDDNSFPEGDHEFRGTHGKDFEDPQPESHIKDLSTDLD